MSLSFSHAHSQGSGTTEVVAVLIAITNNTARVLTVDEGKLLPNGPLMPLHRSLQAGVRQWVEAQTGQPLGYIEQLYTFVDTNRRNKDGHALVYVSYMGLVQEADVINQDPNYQASASFHQKVIQLANEQDQTARLHSMVDMTAQWRDWYDYFPWENHLHNNIDRKQANINSLPKLKHCDSFDSEVEISDTQKIVSQLFEWSTKAKTDDEKRRRLQRICLCWGCDWENSTLKNNNMLSRLEDNVKNSAQQEMFSEWVAEHALLRYEMLYEAGLLPESPNYQPSQLPENWQQIIGEPMYYDHRRVIATAISRLRAKIEYRPLIFGLMPSEFTLLQLQQSVEALSGLPLHKQNFRRLLESQHLLEPTGNSSQTGRGRPAKLFRFRYDVELQSLLMDSKLPKR